LPNSVIGSLVATGNIIAQNPIDKGNSVDSNALMFRKGYFPNYATTLGNVIAGTQGISPRLIAHEQAHVLQARLFGPVFYPSLISQYGLNTVLPYWLIYHDKKYPKSPIGSFGEYFTHGVYPHVWAEEWAYTIGGQP
jgi:hypothetical protein